MDHNEVFMMEEIPETSAEEAQIMGFSDIFEQLLADAELIYTIPAEEQDRFRKGLAVAKSRFVERIKKQNMPEDKRILDFQVVADSERDGLVDIQVSLKDRSGMQIYKVRRPNPSI